MYFNESERIALRMNSPRSQLEKVDEFLAHPLLKQFELGQLQDKTLVPQEALLSMVAEYEREKVLRKTTRYICPKHDRVLRIMGRGVGECEICKRQYLLKDCLSFPIYERIVEPQRYSANQIPVPVVIIKEQKERSWWKRVEVVIGLILGALSCIFTFISVSDRIFLRDAKNINWAIPYSLVSPTIESSSISTATPEPTLTFTVPQIEITEEVTIKPATASPSDNS